MFSGTPEVYERAPTSAVRPPLDRAHAGEEIVLAKASKPSARLVPLAPVREPGGLDGELGDEFFDALPDDELVAWEVTTKLW